MASDNYVRELAGTPGAVSAFSGLSSTLVYSRDDNRLGYSVFNIGPGDLYVLHGTVSATTSMFTYFLKPGDFYESMWGYCGPVTAIFASTGSARFQEVK